MRIPSPFAVALVLTLLAAPTAQADLSACGDIHVEAEGMCEVSGGVECKAQCTVTAVVAACAARLHAQCEPMCAELPSADCSGECTGGCDASCTDFEPGEFDCQGECTGSCTADCAGRCEAADDQARCEASCTASCDGRCQGSCDGVPPSADCMAACEGSCEGSCDVDANLDCEAGCEADLYAGCEGELQVDCEAACEHEDGALFCDGHYVDHGDNLASCLDALAEELNIMASGSSEASCGDGECSAMAEGKVSSSCAVSAPGHGRSTSGLLALGLLVLLPLRRRYHDRSRR